MTYLEELEAFYATAALPERIFIPPCTTITNVRSFVETHLGTVRTYWGLPIARPYLRRLLHVKEQINGTRHQADME